ncbi:MAG TPA: hypothetical protein PKA58_30430, partial [Polyangium sp.]|nr:hypothetical protein [Polyangium sp.]
MKLANVLVPVCLLVPSAAFAADPSNMNVVTSMPSDAAKKAAFKALVDKANQASLSGRLVEAADAYFAALEMQRNPIVAGRLGLVLVKLGKTDRAAEQLQEAVVRGQGAPPWERLAVQQAYDKARSMTTLVNVDISHAGTKVTYDGAPTNPLGLSGYWMFALPGEHSLRATLDGYDEAVATFVAKPGEEIVVTLK